MAKWEEDLPPIMRERLAKIGELTPEEKERIKDSDHLTSLLSDFYKGDVNAEGLWKRMKEYKDKSKVHLLKEAQIKLIASLSFGSSDLEFQNRKEGILAIETLKEDQNTPMLEQNLNNIKSMQKRYKEEMERAYNEYKTAVERNPQLRMQQVKQGKATIVMELTVDEAVKILPEWKTFIKNHDNKYNQEFIKAVDNLKQQIK